MLAVLDATETPARLANRQSSRTLSFPSHRALLAELRAFEYGLVDLSHRAPMGARLGAHDDTVMGLAIAVYAAPEAAHALLASRIIQGSLVGGSCRVA